MSPFLYEALWYSTWSSSTPLCSKSSPLAAGDTKALCYSPQQRPSLYKGHFLLALGVVITERDHCTPNTFQHGFSQEPHIPTHSTLCVRQLYTKIHKYTHYKLLLTFVSWHEVRAERLQHVPCICIIQRLGWSIVHTVKRLVGDGVSATMVIPYTVPLVCIWVAVRKNLKRLLDDFTTDPLVHYRCQYHHTAVLRFWEPITTRMWTELWEKPPSAVQCTCLLVWGNCLIFIRL